MELTVAELFAGVGGFRVGLNKIKEIDILRKKVDYLTDGVVIKVNDFELREFFGYTNKFPRFAIAYKFEAEEYSTVLKEVVWNVGRTGKSHSNGNFRTG